MGGPEPYSHSVDFSFSQFSGAGVRLAEACRVGSIGLESAARADGGVVVASFNPTGPYGPYSLPAYLKLSQSEPGAYFIEVHPELVQQWYGDIGLTATEDGGSIFAWSQVRERFGIFAIRMNPAGIVTGVPPGAPSQDLRVWYARGTGLQVTDGQERRSKVVVIR